MLTIYSYSIVIIIFFCNFYRSPALSIDCQSNKNPKVDEGKFETENRRRAEKLLKKQYGLKPVDSWRKHKKALNAAKYYEELPATEKLNSNPEPKVPIETKPDPKIVKTVKSNKKVSSISLPVIKQVNNSESPVTVLNSPVEIVKKPIASVAPYQIVLPKQPVVTIVQPERTIEKCNVSKTKPIQAVQNKVEKESATRTVVSKKSTSDDDGLLVEYKCMKKKNKSERKASLPPSTSPESPLVEPPIVIKPKGQHVERFNSVDLIKPKVQTLERCNTPEITKPKVQAVERFNTEVVKPKVQSMERCSSPDVFKPKVQAVEGFNLPEVIKSKIQTTERFNLSEVTKQNSNEVIGVVAEKEKKEILSLNLPHTDQYPDVEKKITVLKRGSDKKHVDISPIVNNKQGNVVKNILTQIQFQYT